MQKYKDVIMKVLNNKPILGDENINPNTERRMDEVLKIRKVNFKLQDEKAQLIQQLKMLRQSYYKFKKSSEKYAVDNKKLKQELSKTKDKLTKTQTIKNKIEKRLYSSRTRSVLSKQNASTKSNSVMNTERVALTTRGSYEICIQTDDIQKYNIGIQTEPEVLPKTNKPKKQTIKCQILSPCTITQSEKLSCYETEKTSFRTSTDGALTERVTGRIVKGKKRRQE